VPAVAGGVEVKDTLRDLEKRERDEVARQDAACIAQANEHLIGAWESLSAYFLRHPLRENEVSEFSMAFGDIRQAIKHMDRGGIP
jgi:hypothetical protein